MQFAHLTAKRLLEYRSRFILQLAKGFKDGPQNCAEEVLQLYYYVSKTVERFASSDNKAKILCRTNGIMKREQIENYIKDTFPTEADHPWAKYPDYVVYRRQDNRKWFAIIMRIPRTSLGLGSTDMLDIINLKLDPSLIDSLRTESGFYPAYHMNKVHWISAALDDSTADDKLKTLLELSYDITAPAAQKKS